MNVYILCRMCTHRWTEVGLIVNSMQDAHSAEEGERTDAYRDEVLERLKSIEAQLNAVKVSEAGPVDASNSKL